MLNPLSAKGGSIIGVRRFFGRFLTSEMTSGSQRGNLYECVWRGEVYAIMHDEFVHESNGEMYSEFCLSWQLHGCLLKKMYMSVIEKDAFCPHTVIPAGTN